MEFTSWIISAKKICTASYLLGVNSERITPTPPRTRVKFLCLVAVYVYMCVCAYKSGVDRAPPVLHNSEQLPMPSGCRRLRNDNSCWKESPKEEKKQNLEDQKKKRKKKRREKGKI